MTNSRMLIHALSAITLRSLRREREALLVERDVRRDLRKFAQTQEAKQIARFLFECADNRLLECKRDYETVCAIVE